MLFSLYLFLCQHPLTASNGLRRDHGASGHCLYLPSALNPHVLLDSKALLSIFYSKGVGQECVCDSEGTDRGGNTLKVTGMAWHG